MAHIDYQPQIDALLRGFQQIQGLKTGHDDDTRAARDVNKRQHDDNRRGQDDMVRQTATCSGSPNAAVRQWMTDIQIAFDQLGQRPTIDVVTRTVAGPLRREVQHFLRRQAQDQAIDRLDVPWQQLRQHVIAQFLSADEEASLRDRIERDVLQAKMEPENQFSRRFREAAEDAYPEANRNADQHRLLVRAYARGLHQEKLARKLMEDHNPATLPQAIGIIADLCARTDAYERLNRPHTRHEEPMDVSSVTKDADHLMLATMQSMVATMHKMSSRMDDMACAQAKPAPLPARDNAPSYRQNAPRDHLPNFDDQGRPKCFQCNKYGHFARNCHDRQRRQYAQRPHSTHSKNE